VKVAYLGPAGTFSDEALRIAAAGRAFDGVPCPTIHAAIESLEAGEADRAFVPIENSIEGTVRPTLDALAFGAEGVAIVGEFDHAVREALIARLPLELGEIEVVLSHPQPLAQCARFLRESLPGAEVRSVSSTSEGVRAVAESEEAWAALGSAAAAAAYGCVVVREDVADEEENVTRFAWLAPTGAPPPAEDPACAWRTTLVFWELGDDRPGALTEALAELSDRGINMTRIESRPRRAGLGRYLFFIDVDGRADGGIVAEGIEALRGQAETVRVLGSYQVGGPPPLD
jgi:prephenate dehydratase